MKWYWIHKNFVQHEKRQPGCIWSLLRIFGFHRSHSIKRLLTNRRHHNGADSVVGRKPKIMTSGEKHKKSYSSVDNGVDGKMLEPTRISDVNSDQQPTKMLSAHEFSKGDLKELSFSTSERRKVAMAGQKHKNRTAKTVHNLQPNDEGSSNWKKHDPNNHLESVEQFTSSIDQDMPDGLSVVDTCQVSMLESQEVHDILNTFTEALVNQKIYEAERLSKDGGILTSKELMDALEILNSDKELFVKLLRDPNSLLVKHIERLRNMDIEQMSIMKSNWPSEEAKLSGANVDKELNMQSGHRSSKEKHGLWVKESRDSSMEQGERSQSSTKIVVLKPAPPSINSNMGLTSARSSSEWQHDLRNQKGKKLASPFFLKEIKRKLMPVILGAKRKQNHLSTDDILHLNSYNYEVSDLSKSPTRNRVGGEASIPIRRITTPRCESWKENKWISQRVTVDELSSPHRFKCAENKNVTYSGSLCMSRESATTSEVKRDLPKILSAEDADESLLLRSPRRTLGKLLSVPDYSLLSRRSSPDREAVETRASPCGLFAIECSSYFKSKKSSECKSPPREDLELNKTLVSERVYSSFLGSSSARTEIEVPANSFVVDNLNDSIIPEGPQILKGEGEDEPANSQEKGTTKVELSIPPEPDCIEVQSTNHVDSFFCSPEKMATNVVLEYSTEDSPADMNLILSLPLSSSCQSLNQDVLPENGCEKLQQPSPLSILELDCSEDDSTPEICPHPQQEEIPIKPRKLHFEEREDSKSISDLSSSGYVLCRNAIHSEPSNSEEEDSCSELKEIDLEYMKLLLEASNLTSSQGFYHNWYSSSQALGESLFFLIDPPSEVSVDQLLLFDCINEALSEISEQYLAFLSLVPCSTHRLQPVLVGEHLLKGVWERVNSYLPLNSKTSDQYIERDLAKCSKWTELRLNMECLGEEIELSLLEDLVQDIVNDLAS